jgi:hypothetical protein
MQQAMCGTVGAARDGGNGFLQGSVAGREDGRAVRWARVHAAAE